MGSAPYLGGGFGHFYAYAPTKIEYAIDQFAMEAKDQLDVLDRRLAESEYLAGGRGQTHSRGFLIECSPKIK
jgi:GSH-dependent disulfide-bond oxidoreductase